MKIDIEGQELEVMLDIIVNGALHILDEVHLDWTGSGPFVNGKGTKKLAQALDTINKLANQYGLLYLCAIRTIHETYLDFNGTLSISLECVFMYLGQYG